MADHQYQPHNKPCARCPWVKATPPGQFAACRYELLRSTSEQVAGEEPGLDAPWFACHKTPLGKEQPCAGWLVAMGANHLGVRWAVIQGRLDPARLWAGDDWPDVYDTYDDMVRDKVVPGQGEE